MKVKILSDVSVAELERSINLFIEKQKVKSVDLKIAEKVLENKVKVTFFIAIVLYE